MTRRAPLRRSLVGRLLATSIVIAVAAVASTAWLATQITSRAIRQEQGRSLSDDKSVYGMLIDYATTHRDWTGAQQVIETRAADLGRRIILTNDDREIIVDSGQGGLPATARDVATVDPLRLDQGLTGNDDRIDPRGLGPYRLPPQEREQLRAAAQAQLNCLRSAKLDGILADDSDGRPTVQVTTADPDGSSAICAAKNRKVTATEQRALDDLATMTARCLGLTDKSRLFLARDLSLLSLRLAPADMSLDVRAGRVRSCTREAFVQQLRPYVAPPALLFVTDPDATTEEPVFSLSRANIFRIVWVTGAVLLATILLAVLTGRRLVGPLRALTDAAAQPLDRRAPMPVARDDEIGSLARALNDLTERRDRAEAQRRVLVSDVAHELRSPLTNIRAWLEVAQDGVVPVDPALLELLQDEATMLHHIIDDLSDLAASEAGDLRLHREPVYIRDLLTQACESHRSTAETAHLTLITELHGDPVVSVDPVRLRQLVSNLLSNAIRYTPPGGTVTLTAAAPAQELTIAVRDTGIGISADDLPKVFDRFWRADTSRTRATGGSGLGLPIARRLAEAHGGTLTTQSHPGEGTTMTLRLPVTD
ncbi:sensor histidine kinase [Actinoplanes sp. GCM10030250]|uniref:sensor histidine kinase n=1 Tax=Actinoplanes sp. GCM10030250 TaxID=3273376 RepID=UPI00361B6D10